MKILFLLVAFLCLIASPVVAADLAWDYPADWAIIDGYTLVFNETGQTDAPYTKTFDKTGITQAGVEVLYQDIEIKLNLSYGQEYDISLVAWNVAGVSDPSNTLQYTRPAYNPPADTLPTGTVITIPNAAVTIRVQ